MVNEGSGASVLTSLDGALTRTATDDGTGNPSIDYLRSDDRRLTTWRSGHGMNRVRRAHLRGRRARDQRQRCQGSLFASDATSVAFQGGIGTGVYVSSAATARVVADTTMTMPGQSILFAGFESGVAFDDGNVAFLGAGTLSTDPLVQVYGIYAEIAYADRIADSQTLIPAVGRCQRSAHRSSILEGGRAAVAPRPVGGSTSMQPSSTKVVGVGISSTRTVSGFGPRGLSGPLAFNAT
jgi:hypothetical protein